MSCVLHFIFQFFFFLQIISFPTFQIQTASRSQGCCPLSCNIHCHLTCKMFKVLIFVSCAPHFVYGASRKNTNNCYLYLSHVQGINFCVLCPLFCVLCPTTPHNKFYFYLADFPAHQVDQVSGPSESSHPGYLQEKTTSAMQGMCISCPVPLFRVLCPTN